MCKYTVTTVIWEAVAYKGFAAKDLLYKAV